VSIIIIIIIIINNNNNNNSAWPARSSTTDEPLAFIHQQTTTGVFAKIDLTICSLDVQAIVSIAGWGRLLEASHLSMILNDDDDDDDDDIHIHGNPEDSGMSTACWRQAQK